jgi:hypothetical protein
MIAVENTPLQRLTTISLPKRQSKLLSAGGRLTPDFAKLARRLVVAFAFEFDGKLPHRCLRRLVREAEAVALQTPVPMLALPVLAEEKVRSALDWQSRQQDILNRSVVSLTE